MRIGNQIVVHVCSFVEKYLCLFSNTKNNVQKRLFLAHENNDYTSNTIYLYMYCSRLCLLVVCYVNNENISTTKPTNLVKDARVVTVEKLFLLLLERLKMS